MPRRILAAVTDVVDARVRQIIEQLDFLLDGERIAFARGAEGR